jgi:cation diffusion facilitator CzcD-associated flavoprotein CzcO
VGTGASAIQFVPEIQPLVKRLHLFQRTPPWVMPRANPRIPARWQERFAQHPRTLHALRKAVFSLLESFHVMFSHPRLTRSSERRAKRHIANQVSDPVLRARLTPNYRLGCKRILGSNDWYPAITADNVQIVDTGVKELTETGIVDERGIEHPVDTIIFGTGFHVTDPPISHRVTGRQGETLAERWAGSPKAHLGLSVAGFPNFFLLLGPNTGLGHNSVLLMIEAQVRYVMQALRYRRARRLTALEPTEEAQAGFIEEIDRQTDGSVWTAGGCVSWYLDATGRNSTLWPGSVRAYQRRVARFDPADYRVHVGHPVPEPIAA